MSDTNSYEASSPTPSKGQSRRNSHLEDEDDQVANTHMHNETSTKQKTVIIRRSENESSNNWSSNWDNDWQADGDRDDNDAANASLYSERGRNSSKQLSTNRKKSNDIIVANAHVASERERERVPSGNVNGGGIRQQNISENRASVNDDVIDDESDIESASQINRAPIERNDGVSKGEAVDADASYTNAKKQANGNNNLLMNAFNIVQVVPPQGYASLGRGSARPSERSNRAKQPTSRRDQRASRSSERASGAQPNRRDLGDRKDRDREREKDRGQLERRSRRTFSPRRDEEVDPDDSVSIRDDESHVSIAQSHTSDRSGRGHRRNSESRELSRNLNKFLQILMLKEERDRPLLGLDSAQPTNATSSFSHVSSARKDTKPAAPPSKARPMESTAMNTPQIPRKVPEYETPKITKSGVNAPPASAASVVTPFGGPAGASSAEDPNAYYYRWYEYMAAWYAQVQAQSQATAEKSVSKFGTLPKNAEFSAAAPTYVNSDRPRAGTRQSVSAMSGTGSRFAHGTDDEGASAWTATASVVSDAKHHPDDDALTYDNEHEQHSDGRVTPEKFVRRHACARFARGVGGPVLCIIRPAATDADRSLVEVVDIRKLQQKQVLNVNGATRPTQAGAANRLVGNFAFGAFAHCTKAVRSEVLYALQDLTRFFSSASFRDHESAALLCAFLECLVRKNGSLSCADVAEFLLEHDSTSPHTLKGWRLTAAARKNDDASGADFGKLDSSRMSTRLEETAGDTQTATEELETDRSRLLLEELDEFDVQSVLSTAPGNDIAGDLPALSGTLRAAEYRRFVSERERRERCVRKYRELLLGGKPRVALDYAVAHGLWPHALFVLQRCFASDRVLQQTVMTRFVERECTLDDPLRTFYELALGVPPSFAAPLPLASNSASAGVNQPDSLRFLKANWKLHVAMMVVSLQEAFATCAAGGDAEAVAEANATVERTLQSITTLAGQFAQANHRFVAQLLFFLSALLRAGNVSGSAPNEVINRDCKLVLLGNATPQALADFAKRTFVAADGGAGAGAKALRSTSNWAALNDVRELNIAPASAALRFREACFKTVEIFEYALTCLDGSLYLTGLQAFKYIYMTQLIANGQSEMAIRYAESLANVLVIEDRDRRQARPGNSSRPGAAQRVATVFSQDLAPAVGRAASLLLGYQSRRAPAAKLRGGRFEMPIWLTKLLGVSAISQTSSAGQQQSKRRVSTNAAAAHLSSSLLGPAAVANVQQPASAVRMAPLNQNQSQNHPHATVSSTSIHSSAMPPPQAIPPPQPQPQPQQQQQQFKLQQQQQPQQQPQQLQPMSGFSMPPPSQPAPGRASRPSVSADRDEQLFDRSFQPASVPAPDAMADSRRRTNTSISRDTNGPFQLQLQPQSQQQQQIRDTLNNSFDAPHQQMQPTVPQQRLPFQPQNQNQNQMEMMRPPMPAPAPVPAPAAVGERERRPTDGSTIQPPPPPPPQQQQHLASRSRTPGSFSSSSASRSRTTSGHGLSPIDSEPSFNIDVQNAPPASAVLPPAPPSRPNAGQYFAGPPLPTPAAQPVAFTSQPSLPFNTMAFGNPLLPPMPPPVGPRPPQPQSAADSASEPDRNESPSGSPFGEDTDLSGESPGGNMQEDLDEDDWRTWASKPKGSGYQQSNQQGKQQQANDASSRGGANDSRGRQDDSSGSANLSGSSNAGNSGWFTGIGSKLKDAYEKIRPHQAHLPDDKHKSIVWDDKLKAWVDNDNKSGTGANSAPPPPPPMPAMAMPPRRAEPAAGTSSGSGPAPPVGPPAAGFGGMFPPSLPSNGDMPPPPLGENMFSAQRGLNRGLARNKYATPAFLAQPQPQMK